MEPTAVKHTALGRRSDLPSNVFTQDVTFLDAFDVFFLHFGDDSAVIIADVQSTTKI